MTLENTNKIYKILEILNAAMRSWSDRDYLRIDIETWKKKFWTNESYEKKSYQT